jgi:hypothetical protein
MSEKGIIFTKLEQSRIEKEQKIKKMNENFDNDCKLIVDFIYDNFETCETREDEYFYYYHPISFHYKNNDEIKAIYSLYKSRLDDLTVISKDICKRLKMKDVSFPDECYFHIYDETTVVIIPNEKKYTCIIL